MTENTFLLMQKELSELRKQLEFFQKKSQNAEDAYLNLLHSFKEFQRHRFGSKSERYVSPEQEDMFAVKKSLPQSCEALKNSESQDNVVSITGYQRRKRNQKRFPPGLPRREVIIPVEDKICDCGTEKEVIRYEMTELLNYQPPVFEIIEQKREVVVCKSGCEHAIEMAPNPLRILPRSNTTPSLLAHVIVRKLHDRQPHYHLEKRLIETIGLECRRNKLSRWFIETADYLQPLLNLSKDEVIDYDIASTDATGIQVLREPNRSPTKKSYAYCMRGGAPDKRVILYEYNAEKHKQFLATWFAGFKGSLHVDAQNIYEDLSKSGDIELLYCNSHARRKFEPIAKAVQFKEGLATKAMDFYQKIYRIERQAKQVGSTPEARHGLRLEETLPLFTEFKSWLDEEYPTTLRDSLIAKAMKYVINHWGGLTAFLKDGRLEIDNNHTEREIKPWVMARKAFLFATSVEGARALCIHMSLVRTAILHGFDPYRYYVKVLQDIPYCRTSEDFELLLPWNIDLPKVMLLKVA